MSWTCVVSEHVRGEETAGADNEWEEPVAHGRCECCLGSLYLILFDFSFSVRGRLRYFSRFVPDSFLLFPMDRCHEMMLLLAGVNYMKT